MEPKILELKRNPQLEDRNEMEGRKDPTSQKPFADWVLNTVVEVTIYLMPAKLARTSGAGYLVQLFMISSKI